MSIKDYIAAQRANIESIGQLPHFQILGDLTNTLYEQAISLVPKSSPPPFGQLLLICHKSFLSALTLIGQAQPDDAGAVSRRAIEAARLALAIKNDSHNAIKWAAHEERMGRWHARERGDKPQPLKPKLTLPKNHAILSELERQIGILSDSSVHFTPEYFGAQQWVRTEARIELRYFTSDQTTIEQDLITLMGIHAHILRLFDECLDGPFFSNTLWNQTWEELGVSGKSLAEAFKPNDYHE